MTTNPRVGGEIDAFCTRCELPLAHTILAMVGPKIVRVRCNTCMNEHAFRGAAAPKAKKPRATRTPAAEKIVIAFEERLKSHDLTKARKYSPKESFALEEVMNHPTFGYGIVSAVRGDKLDVAFKAFEKTLLQKRADGQAARPMFAATQPKPRVDDGSTPDAPAPDASGGTSIVS